MSIDESQEKEAFFLSFFSFSSPFGDHFTMKGETQEQIVYIYLSLSLSLSKEGKACCTDVDFGAVLASLRKDL